MVPWVRKEAIMLAGSVTEEVLLAEAAAAAPDAVLTDRLEFDIESALGVGWRPGRARHARRAHHFCGLHRRRRAHRADEAIFRP